MPGCLIHCVIQFRDIFSYANYFSIQYFSYGLKTEDNKLQRDTGSKIFKNHLKLNQDEITEILNSAQQQITAVVQLRQVDALRQLTFF